MNKKKSIIEYSFFFAVLIILLYGWYFISGKTLIWKNDGWMQYYRALIYYAEALRQAFAGLFIGKGFNFPLWDMAIGEGDDVFLTLGYYVLGDPFTVFSVFVPSTYMYIFSAISVFAKLYVAGLFFILLFAEFVSDNNQNEIISIEAAGAAGAIVYVFSYWGLLNSVRHPFFLNPFIYFPLVLLGVEKTIKHKRSRLLPVAVMLSAISNYYFFVMIVMLTVIYTAIRLLFLYKTDIKSIVNSVISIAMSSVSGVLMGAFILIPSYMALLDSSRVGGNNIRALLYPWEYYRRLPGLFLSTGGGVDVYWMCMGFTGISLIAIGLLFKEKGNAMLKIMLVLSFIFILFPIFGQAFNGMSYMANRWSFALALLVAFSTARMLDLIAGMKKRDIVFSAILSIAYLILVTICAESRTMAVYCSLGILIVVILALGVINQVSKNNVHIDVKKINSIIVFMAIVLGICCNFFFMNSSMGDDYFSEIKTASEAKNNVKVNESEAVKQAAADNADTEFYRYESDNPTLNAGFSQHISTSQHYWTSGISSVSDYRREMAVAQGNSYNYRDYDGKVIPMLLSSIKYYVTAGEGDEKIPYGYEKLEKEYSDSAANEYDIYKNEDALPLGYTYDSYILKSEWQKLNMAQRQEVMLSTVVLDDEEKLAQGMNIKELSADLDSVKVDYSVSHPDKVEIISDNAIKIAGKDKSITLELDEDILADFSDDEDYEVYVYAEGMNFIPKDAGKFYQNMSGGVTLSFDVNEQSAGQIRYLTNNNSHYDGKTDYMEKVYGGTGIPKQIKIDFSHVGAYEFDELSVFVQPMKKINSKAAILGENLLENVIIDTNSISGSIDLEAEKILCVTVPYSKGFSAYVDGERAPIYRANIKNMALMLKPGRHEIIFKYTTPYLGIAMMVSIISIILFVGMCVYDYKKNHK